MTNPTDLIGIAIEAIQIERTCRINIDSNSRPWKTCIRVDLVKQMLSPASLDELFWQFLILPP